MDEPSSPPVDPASDRALGMDRPITRRDVLHGMAALAAAGAAGPFSALAAADAAGDDYPPARTGLRGSQPGSFEAAHAHWVRAITSAP